MHLSPFIRPLSVPLSLSCRRRRGLSSVVLYLLSRVSCLSCAASPQGKSETNCGVNSKRFIRKWELSLVTNFESDKSAAYYANMYKRDSLTGGHVIMLGVDPLSQVAALEGLHAYPEWKILTEMAKV
ncbi:1-(5-phosphoribosyl)-5-[(5-phosphoribosylamino)methylideneamino] imidazole-4-carboxamide isomerase HISN3, chloroplastic-like isoform X1 [Carex rostrata]